MADDHKEGLSDAQQILLLLAGIVLIVLTYAALKPDLFLLWQRAAVWHAEVLSQAGDNSLGRAFYSAIGASGEQLHQLGRALAKRDAADFSGELVWKVSEYIGKVLRWFLAPPLLLLSWDVLQYPKRYRRRFANGVSLVRYVQKSFGGYLARAENALEADLYCGLHAVAKTPWQWAIDNQCVKADEALDEARAIDAFRGQLGATFKSWEQLLAGERGWIAKEILASLRNPQDRQDITAYATRGHCYESTVLVALLLGARRFGVVSCMMFAGLRRTDRALWYALESAGRRVAFVEAAGILAQYEYEMALLATGDGKFKPQQGRVEAALPGLKEALEYELHEARSPGQIHGGVWTNYDPTKY